jgi:hypothetical protein
MKQFAAILCLFMAGFLSCDSGEEYEGVYAATGTGRLQDTEIVIELREKGLGVWRVEDDEASFRWEVRGDEIRLMTKAGGIIIGRIQKDALEIGLPGTEMMSFQKRPASAL